MAKKNSAPTLLTPRQLHVVQFPLAEDLKGHLPGTLPHGDFLSDRERMPIHVSTAHSRLESLHVSHGPEDGKGPSAMISTALLLPSLARALSAKRARKRTAKAVFPERFRRASESEERDEGSWMVMLLAAERDSQKISQIFFFDCGGATN